MGWQFGNLQDALRTSLHAGLRRRCTKGAYRSTRSDRNYWRGAESAQPIVQIEMIGFSKEKPWLPDDETLAALASLMAVCADEYGIPLEHPWPDGDFGKAGKNPHRSSGKYGKVPGWYGHGDCPSPDTHWDPGNLKWTEVLGMAKHMTHDIGAPPSVLAGPAALVREQNPTAVSKKKPSAMGIE